MINDKSDVCFACLEIPAINWSEMVAISQQVAIMPSRHIQSSDYNLLTRRSSKCNGLEKRM